MGQGSELENLRIFVINRKQDVDRRRTIAQRLDAIGLTPEYIDAIDGYSMDAFAAPEYDRSRRLLYFGRDLAAGEIGCLLSHRLVYKKIMEEEIGISLILEDDAHFAADFPEVLQQVIEAKDNWDMVRFLDRPKIFKAPHRIVHKLSDKYSIARIRGVPGGAYAYLLKHHAAEVLLAKSQHSTVQIDIVHGRYWETGLNVLVTKPSPVVPDMDIDSTIGDGRFMKENTTNGFRKLFFPIFRFLFKLNTSIRARLYYAKMKKADQRNWEN